jgi:signal transduction histidine kinase
MIPVELEINDAAARLETAGTSVIPDDMRLGVYRIAELAMGNVAKHARATVCSVGWSYDELDQQLVMTVTDDGIGFDPAEVRQTGLGMVNIGDYADAMNATLEIESEPGRGTRLKLVIPFEAPITLEEMTGQHGQVESGVSVSGVTGEQPSAA